jgi:cysteine-rich repeat protein
MRGAAFGLVLATAHVACGDDNEGSGECGNGAREAGEQCDDGNTSSGDGCSSTCRNEARCGNMALEGTEQCDDGNTMSGDGCSGTCQTETAGECGNGERERDESCDDGNTTAGDGCSATCELEMGGAFCGNGVREGAEQCDDANVTSSDGCSATCQLEAGPCGDGVINIGEQCDDGNTSAGDGCDASCQLEGSFCGNGTIDAGEDCDDGNGVGGDGCSAACLLESCGDGLVQTGEECDDGNTIDGDGCDAACDLEIPAGCGNGVLETGEECDDGGHSPGDGCAANCRTEPTGVCLPDWTLGCGESDSWSTLYAGATDAIDLYEACVPWDESGPEYAYTFVATSTSNVTLRLQGTTADLDLFVLADSGDTCDETNCVAAGDFAVSFTTVPGRLYYVVVDGYLGADGPYSVSMTCGSCGDGLLDPAEQCDDGNMASGDGCSSACVLEGCGNGTVEAGEECDAGDVNPCDGCSPTCRFEGCGNFVVECAETCDDGGTTSGDGCSSTCAFEGGSCTTDFALTCGERDGWSTTFTGATDLVDFYSCVPWNESGPEYAYTFTAPRSGAVTVAVTTSGGLDLDVFVLGPESAGVCDSSTCLAGGDRAATFVATLGQTYYVVVDGYLGAEGSYEVSVSCGGGACGNGVLDAGEQCDDGGTTSGDGCTATCRREFCGDGVMQALLGEQCDDGGTAPGDGCSATCILEPTVRCAPDLLISCNQADTHANGGAGSTNVVPTYACWSFAMTGPEYAYAVVPVETTMMTATLSNLTADLDLVVLRDDGACNPASGTACLTGGDTSVTWNAVAGQRYYLVVDGDSGATSSYSLTLLCNGVACGDGALEQGEECDDADTSGGDGCSNVCQLEGGTCQADLQITCGGTDSWDTRLAGSTDRVDAYACESWAETGREYTYQFIATRSGPVTIDLTETPGNDLDVIVLLSENGLCTPGDCLAQGNTTVTFDAIAGEVYDIVVDGFGGDQGPFAIDVSCD